MDNILYRDYAAWKLENIKMLEQFQNNKSVVYERLEPVYVVLEYIYELVCDQTELDEDYETIFEVGFNYLSSQFEIIKIYFETLFQSKCEDFHDYSKILLYLIYLLDVRNDLETQGFDSDIEELNELETTIENMIMERKADYTYISDLMNETLSKVLKELNFEFVSIVDIFVEIAESLGIFLYEDDDFVVGREV